MLRISTPALLFLWLAAQATAEAQHDTHVTSEVPPERLGVVQFETSCAQAIGEEFNRAVALLHSFEFGTAIDGFESVLAKDAECAMAYWGIALSHWGNPFGGTRSSVALQRGAAAIGTARTLSATPREQSYIAAAAQLFENYPEVSQRDRVLAYEEAMAEVMRGNPQDAEAAIFYALALNQTALPTDKSYSAQLEAAGILESLVERFPDHPGLTHYIIHAYDHPPLASRALGAARRYAEIAPSAPHALHMPSHTFTRVGAWKESAETNLLSEQVAIEHGSATEALHAMDYQAYAYLQMAQDRKARDVLDRLPTVVAMFDPDGAGGAAPPMAGYFAMTAIPARYALERGDWQAAARFAVPERGTPFTIAIAHFTRAIGAARSGNPGAAKPELERLSALRDELIAAGDAYWAEQVDIQRRVAAAWAAFAEGHSVEAVQSLRAAADMEDATDKSAVTPGPLAPARELLGEMLLEVGDAAEALVELEASMAKEPGRFRGADAAARAAEAAGDPGRARQHIETLIEIAYDSDTERPAVRRARMYRLTE